MVGSVFQWLIGRVFQSVIGLVFQSSASGESRSEQRHDFLPLVLPSAAK